MDAPKSRYRVVEKDGRLVVIDNSTGAPASPPPPRPPGPARPGSPGPAPVVETARGTLDRIADALLTLAVREWDGEGRAVIAWQWKENGRTKRWDARLDGAQQRRLGRALLAVAAAPLLVLLLIVLDGGLMWLAAALAAPPIVWGVAAIHRLRRETGGQAPPGG